MNILPASDYENLKESFQNYFQIVERLGHYYFIDKKSTNVYLTIDSEGLNRLFDEMNEEIELYLSLIHI